MNEDFLLHCAQEKQTAVRHPGFILSDACLTCDCCLRATRTTCTAFFYVYVAIFLLTLVALAYHERIKMQINRQLTHNSMGQIFAFVVIWQASRIAYLSAVFGTSTVNQNVCYRENLQNLPVYCMLVCVAVTHEFLIRVYLLMTGRLEKHKGKLILY